MVGRKAWWKPGYGENLKVGARTQGLAFYRILEIILTGVCVVRIGFEETPPGYIVGKIL